MWEFPLHWHFILQTAGQYGLSCHSCGSLPHGNDCPLTHDSPGHNGSMISMVIFCTAAAVPSEFLSLICLPHWKWKGWEIYYIPSNRILLTMNMKRLVKWDGLIIMEFELLVVMCFCSYIQVSTRDSVHVCTYTSGESLLKIFHRCASVRMPGNGCWSNHLPLL